MLSSLHIENIAVIKSLDVDLLRGLTVLTGETGAGKSMIIDSLGLLIGSKLSKDIIRTGEEKAQVCGLFEDIPEDTLSELRQIGVEPDENGCLYIQRTVTADGKSQVRINSRTVPSSIHKAVGSLLINIHGQHENQILLCPESHIKIVDRYSGLEGRLSEYRAHYDEMCRCAKERDRLTKNEREKEQRIDMLNYQIEDIGSAALQPDEDESLENELKILKNSKQIAKHATTVYRALYKNEKGSSAARLTEIARNALDSISDVLPEASEYSDKLYDIQYELENIAKQTLAVIPGGDDPEARIAEIEDRLDVIRKLKRKYGSTVSEVLEFLENAERELKEIESSEEKAGEYDRLYREYREKAEKSALEISRIRKERSEELALRVCSELTFLDMNKVKFAVIIERDTGEDKRPRLSPAGCDKVEFQISTNPGEPLKPLAKIASGGELSRIMLALKCVLLGAEGIPTLIFDEVDTGISGKTAQKIGFKLGELAKDPQVLCITHSAQIAAYADNHLKITKSEVDGRASTGVTALDYDGRVSEIARIMGGAEITGSVINSAKEMIEYSKKSLNK